MNYNDSTRTGKPHPNDGTAMRRYSQTYAYDEVGNLLEVVHTPSSGTGWTRTYTIDSASNRLDENSIGSNAVTAESYTYDARGNIITGFNHLTSLTYNEENRLEKVVLADTNITSYYQYDGSGQRVRKVTKDNNSNGYKQVRKYVGSWEVYEKIDSNNDVVSQRETLHIMDDRARVALIDTPVIAESNTEVQLLRYQFSNHLQTATLELDKVAAIISYEEYYPYGSTSFQSGRSASEVSRKRYRYTGKERDDETGLYYHGARYYAPWLARWIATDPKQSEMPDWSSYNYGFCNPVKWSDMTGMEPGQDEKCTSHTNTSGKQGNQTENKSESTSSPQKAEYTVKKGDTLSAIAKEHGMKVNELRKMNHLDPKNDKKLQIGTKLNFKPEGSSQPLSDKPASNTPSVLDISLTGLGALATFSEIASAKVLKSRSGFTSGKIFPNSPMNYSKVTARNINVGAKTLGWGLTLWSTLSTERDFRLGRISSGRRIDNHLKNTAGALFPLAAIPIAAGDYLGQKYEPQITKSVTKPGGILFETTKFILKLGRIPTGE